MRYLKFKKLTLQNFLSHVNTTFNLDKRGLVLISGDNGAGKTALLPDGLIYALFGKTLRGLRGKDVVNNKVGRDCAAILEMEAESGTPITIFRCQLHESEPKPWVQVGNEIHYGVDEVDKIVTSLLGVEYDTFVAALVFGKGNTRFFTELPDSARKAILDDLLSLNDLTACEAEAKNTLTVVEQDLDDMEKQLIAIDVQISTHQATVESLRQKSEEFEEERKVRLAVAEERREGFRTRYLNLCTKVNELDAELETLELATAKTTDLIAPLAEEINAADEEEGKLRKGISEIDGAMKVEQEWLDEAAKLGATCPICLHALTPEQAKEAEDAHLFAINSMQADKDYLKEMLDIIWTENQEKKTVAKKGVNSQSKRQVRIAGLKSEQSTYVNQSESLLNDIQAQTNEIQRIKAETNNNEEIIEKETERINQLTDDWAELTEDLETVSQKKDRCLFWRKAFSNQGIKSWLLDNIIPYLNERARHYATILSDDKISVEFSTQKTTKGGKVQEKFDVRVTAQDGGDSYTACSDGQRRRADIITTMALGDLAASRVSRPLNLIILDEMFDGLDKAGLEQAVMFLKKLAEEKESVFCSTHDENMAAFFPNVTKVMNEEGASVVVE